MREAHEIVAHVSYLPIRAHFHPSRIGAAILRRHTRLYHGNISAGAQLCHYRRIR